MTARPSATGYGDPSRSPAERPAARPSDGRNGVFMDIVLLSGLFAMQFQVVQFGGAQPAHLWMLAALGLMVFQGAFTGTRTELFAFLAFFAYTVVITVTRDFGRVKEAEQLAKFGLIYPGFYFIGRWLGGVYTLRRMPLGNLFLIGLVFFEVLVQTLQLPVIYRPLTFAAGAIHGTFIERNWLAVYVLLFSYFLFQSSERSGISEEWRAGMFVLVNLTALVFTESKTAMVAVGIILLIKSRQPLWRKIVAVAAGGAAYWYFLGDQFSEANLQVRLEEERGLAFQESIRLISEAPLGHGVGFVEYYFGNLPLFIRGLGAGTNSVFAVPLDLMIIAGPVGLAFWAVLFLGIGTRTTLTLAPIAALSLLNPLHQSEIVMFFIGMLVSQARLKAAMAAAEPADATPDQPARRPLAGRFIGPLTQRAARPQFDAGRT